MNVLRTDIDAVNAKLTVQIAKTDCNEDLEKELRSYKKKANIPGFRPGMVPMGMIKKMYGKYALVNIINQKISDSLYQYIKDNDLQILGEPLPSEEEQKEINLDTDESFEYVFDIALAPEINVTLDKKTKITYYDIEVSTEMIDNQVKSYAGRFGSYESVENAEEKDMIKGSVKDVNGAIEVADAVLCPAYMKDKEQAALFVGAKKTDKITFSPKQAYENNEAEIAAFLKIKKEEVKNISDNFEFTINEITRYKESEIDQSLFDKVFGENSVKNENEFREKIKENIKESLKSNSEYKFALDAKAALTKKLDKVAFPEAFLKRWVLATNKNMSEETLEKDFPSMLTELKWQVVCDKVAKENEIKIEENDVIEQAKIATKAQFAQYGMMNIPDDVLENYAKETLKKEDARKRLLEKALEDKILVAIKSAVKVEEKSISIDDFGKLFEEKK